MARWNRGCCRLRELLQPESLRDVCGEILVDVDEVRQHPLADRRRFHLAKLEDKGVDNVPLFDRQVPVADRIATANRLRGTTLTDRVEAIEVMAISDDPWLRSCAAYAMGEMRLTRFAPTLDQWADDPDPLLRATAVDAREKLRHAAAAAAGVDAL